MQYLFKKSRFENVWSQINKFDYFFNLAVYQNVAKR